LKRSVFVGQSRINGTANIWFRQELLAMTYAIN